MCVGGRYDCGPVDLQITTPEQVLIDPKSDGIGTARRVMVLLLCIVGVQVWLIFGHGLWGSNLQIKAMAAALIIAMLPPVWRPVAWVLDRVRHPTDRQRFRTAAGVGVFALGFLLLMARLQDRQWIPRMHDEFSYLIQARMLSHFRLWMPALPLPEFFDSFHIFVTPVYASKYPPGTALALVPALWLGLPAATSCLVAASLAVAMLYRVTAEMVDGVAGLLAAVLLLSLSWFRALSLMIMPQAIFLAVVGVMLWAYLRWRRRLAWGWLLAIGAAAGWLAILRPMEAVCWTVPLGLAVALDLKHAPWRRWAGATLLLLAGAIPFLSLQLVANIGITDHWYEMPWVAYAQRDIPYEGLGFHQIDPARRPMSALPQKQQYYDLVNVPAQRAHRLDRVWSDFIQTRDVLLAHATLPNALLLILLPVSILELSRRRWVVVLPLLLFLVCFSAYYFFFEWYCLALAPAVVVGVAAGFHAICQTWPKRRWLAVVLIAPLLAAAIAALPRAVHEKADEPMQLIDQESINAALNRSVQSPAVVLFRFQKGVSLDAEPVYNINTPWPDDAPIVRAHDRGERNVDLYRYYARRQPLRNIYRFNLGDRSLQFLGTAAGLGHFSDR